MKNRLQRHADRAPSRSLMLGKTNRPEGLEGHAVSRASTSGRQFDFPVFSYLFPDAPSAGLWNRLNDFSSMTR